MSQRQLGSWKDRNNFPILVTSDICNSKIKQ